MAKSVSKFQILFSILIANCAHSLGLESSIPISTHRLFNSCLNPTKIPTFFCLFVVFCALQISKKSGDWRGQTLNGVRVIPYPHFLDFWGVMFFLVLTIRSQWSPRKRRIKKTRSIVHTHKIKDHREKRHASQHKSYREGIGSRTTLVASVSRFAPTSYPKKKL